MRKNINGLLNIYMAQLEYNGVSWYSVKTVISSQNPIEGICSVFSLSAKRVPKRRKKVKISSEEEDTEREEVEDGSKDEADYLISSLQTLLLGPCK